jgi:glycosyltransferase involved in cell wall biosynthesis
MKIAVCLPSYNEASNIQNITKVVDQGLVNLLLKENSLDAVIVNVDSDSSDGTNRLFKETETIHQKHSIVVDGEGGKGKNILEFCRYAAKNDIDYCVTIDTDITSADPEWVVKLVLPMIEDGAIYVTPSYERSRFEGSSTNHFTFPIIYALTGQIIRQPIAGDFGFTSQLAREMLNSDFINSEAVQKYGIDIFITVTAVRTGKYIANVDLGKKIHAPSFNKLEYMFPQIAASVLMSTTAKFSETQTVSIGDEINILPNLNFNHREAAEEMNKRAISVLEPLELDWIGKEAIDSFLQSTKSKADMVSRWADLLALWFSHFHKLSLDYGKAIQAGQELLPFFVVRATNFWFWAETVEVVDVERIIRQQAELLRDKFNTI